MLVLMPLTIRSRVGRTVLISAYLVHGCAPVTSPVSQLPPGATRVLFIGNSLTYANDMPSMVAEIARADEAQRITHFEAVPRRPPPISAGASMA